MQNSNIAEESSQNSGLIQPKANLGKNLKTRPTLAAAAAAARAEAVAARGVRQTLKGSFSAVSKPNFASKYAFESSRRDLHNALLCTVLSSQFFR